MSEKEKAEYLIELFNFNCKECNNAKLSALLTVNEILKTCGPFKIQYWQSVELEIQILIKDR